MMKASTNRVRRRVIFLGVLLLVVGGTILLMHAFRYSLYEAALRMEEQRAGLVEKTVQLPQGEIVYYDNEQPERPVLVAIHGFGAQKENWLRFARALKPHFRIIAMDLPGHGESSKALDQDYTIPGQVQFLWDFLHQLGIEKVHLAGNSMGGAIASVFADLYPANVSTLILIDPAGIQDFKAPFQEALERGENPLIVHSEADFDALLKLALEKPPFIPWPITEVAAEKAMANASVNEYIFRQITSLPADGFKEILSGIRAPTLILWGAEDRVLHVRNADLFEQQIPKARKIIYPGVGHAPMLEIPERTAADVLDFIQSVTVR